MAKIDIRASLERLEKLHGSLNRASMTEIFNEVREENLAGCLHFCIHIANESNRNKTIEDVMENYRLVLLGI